MEWVKRRLFCWLRFFFVCLVGFGFLCVGVGETKEIIPKESILMGCFSPELYSFQIYFKGLKWPYFLTTSQCLFILYEHI